MSRREKRAINLNSAWQSGMAGVKPVGKVKNAKKLMEGSDLCGEERHSLTISKEAVPNAFKSLEKRRKLIKIEGRT